MGRTLCGTPAAWLAPLLVLALWAGDAEAQSAQVGNLGQTGSATIGLDSSDVAQKFTTGTHVGGYTLTGVDLRLVALTSQGADSAAPRVRVVRGAATGTGSVVVARLTARTSPIPDGAAATYTFAAPANTPLRPSTDHWVVVEAATGGGGDVQVAATASDSEDGTPATGWSIDDGALTRSHGSTAAFAAQTYSFRIRVNGSARTNTAATGRPTISGTASLGRRLEADRGTIADHDGLPAAFAYQWVRVDGTVEADILDATSRAYRLEQADVGKTVKVKLSFVDDAGNMESRTAEAFPATGTVRPAPPHGLAGAALVGNLGRTGGGSDSLGSYDMAQKFTTGANGEGYTLTGIQLRQTAAGGDRAPAAARVVGGAPAGGASVAVATLTVRTPHVPGSATGNIAYEAPPDTVLDPSTDYWVVVEHNGGDAGYVSFQFTVSDAEDADAASGWSIDDAGSRRSAGSTGAFARRPHGASYMIRIFGAARPARPARVSAGGPPTAADGSVRTRPDTAYTFRAGDFGYSDPDGDALASVKIETLPAAGKGALTLGGAALAARQAVARGDIDAGNLRYAPPAGAAGEDIARFAFRVNDGTADSADAYTMTVHVSTAANRAPVAAAGSVRTRPDTEYVFRVSDFGYSDADGDALAGIAIRTLTGLPAGSALRLDGTPVRVGQDVSRARLEAGGLVFAPAAGGTGSPYARFAFTVSDGSAHSAPAAMTIHVVEPGGERAVGAWMPRFGRTVAGQVLAAVEDRMRAPRRPAAEVSLGGRRIGVLPPSGAGSAREGATRTMGGGELLLGSSFSLTGEAAGGGSASFWGSGAVTRFDGRQDGLAVDGEVAGAMLGGDWRRGALTAGLVVAHSMGEGGYGGGAQGGAVEATLTGLYPWLRHALGEDLEVWGAAGYGVGALTLDPDDAPAVRADFASWMAAAGLRGTLLDPGGEGLTLTGRTDAMIVGASTDAAGAAAGTRLEAVEARVTLLRLGLEGALPLRLGGGSVLTPGFELGARHDDGDAEAGLGADIGASLAWADPSSGLTARFAARGLLTHEAGGFRERGLSAALSWEPGTGGRGPRLSLSQSIGGASAGGADALLGRAVPEGLAPGSGSGAGPADLASRRLEARLGYGFAALGGRFTLTPEAGFGLSGTARDYSLGWSLAQRPGSAALSVEARRSESAAAPPEHEGRFRLEARF